MSDLEDLSINEMTYIVWLHSLYFIMGRIIVQSCTTSCLLHCGYNVQESLFNHVQHPVYCIVGTMFKNHCPIMYNILFIAMWIHNLYPELSVSNLCQRLHVYAKNLDKIRLLKGNLI